MFTRNSNPAMKKVSLLFVFLLSFCFGYSQCKVINSETKEPIAFAQIKALGQSTGKLANSKGEFELDSDLQGADSLLISCIGYERKHMPTASLNPQSIIELAPKTEKLYTVSVSAKKIKTTNKTLGITTRSRSKYAHISTDHNGAERATWMPNKYSIPGYLKSINIFITDKGYPDAPFRVHVYACSNMETRPVEELTKTNIIASSKEGNEWVTIDMTDQYIRIPENGCFIGIEWFDSPQSVYFEDTLRMKGRSYDHGSWSDTTYAFVRAGNGMAIGTVSERYINAKNRIWSRNFYSQTADDWSNYKIDESKFGAPDTLDNGYVITVEAKNYYISIPSINIDVAFPKSKIKPEFDKPKNRQLNKLEKVKEDRIKYPQSSVKELFASCQKAFENDDTIYLLKYLCVYKDDDLQVFLDVLNSNVEETGEILPPEDRERAIGYMKELNGELDTAKIKNIDPGTFEIKFREEAYILTVVDGLWRLNPNGANEVDQRYFPLIQVR